MKHLISGRKLNRSKKQREALFSNLMVNLFEHGAIKTTRAKAKSIQSLVDKAITTAKSGGINGRRKLAVTFGKRSLANLLVDKIAKDSTRTSGFTRITTLGERLGDNALMVRIELVDYKAPVKAEPAKPVSTLPSKGGTPAKKTVNKE